MPLESRKIGEGLNRNEEFLKLESSIRYEGICIEKGHSPDTYVSEGSDCDNIQSPVDDGTDGLDFSVDTTHLTTTCHLCQKKYKNKRSLSSHMRVKHKVALNNRSKMPCLEQNCNFRGSRIASLISHLIHAHKKKFQCEKVTFQKQEEFWTWKTKAEDRCSTCYSAVTSAKAMASGDKKFFLRCNRSGYRKPAESSFSVPSTIKKNSMKINAMCTSFMDVSFLREGGAVVIFCRTHYGHKEDHSYVRMNDDERGMIKNLILEGLSSSEIIAVMKMQVPVHRHHLLKYTNIRNISVSQNLCMPKRKGLHRSHPTVKERSNFPMSKFYDISMDIKVENEVEVETDTMTPEVSYSPSDIQKNSCKSLPSAGNFDVEHLRKEVLGKIQQISRLAQGLVSGTSLNSLSERLDCVVNHVKNDEHIEVIPDAIETAGDNQIVLCLKTLEEI